MIYYFLMYNGQLKRCKDLDLQSDVLIVLKAISQQEEINENNLILLASGGLYMEQGKINDYGSGEDNNPIYVFIKNISIKSTSISNVDYINRLTLIFEDLVSKIDLHVGIKRMQMPPKLWLQEVPRISDKLVELSQDLLQNKVIEGVNSQQLLINGCCSALANLFDVAGTAERKIENVALTLKKFQNDYLTNIDQDPRTILIEERVELARNLLNKIKLPMDYPNNLLDWLNERDKETFPGNCMNSLIQRGRQSLLELLGTSTITTHVEYPGTNEGLLKKMETNINDAKSLFELVKPLDYDEDDIKKPTKKRQIDMNFFSTRLESIVKYQVSAEKKVNDLRAFHDYIYNVVKKDGVQHKAVIEDHIISVSNHLENAKIQIRELYIIAQKISESLETVLKSISEKIRWLMTFQSRLGQIEESIYLGRQKIRDVRLGVQAVLQLENSPRIFMSCMSILLHQSNTLQVWHDWGVNSCQMAQNIRLEYIENLKEADDLLHNHFLANLFQPLLHYNLPQFGRPLLSNTATLDSIIQSMPSTDKLNPDYLKDLYNDLRNHIPTISDKKLESKSQFLLRHSSHYNIPSYLNFIQSTNQKHGTEQRDLDPFNRTNSESDSSINIISLIPPPPHDTDDDDVDNNGDAESRMIADDGNDNDIVAASSQHVSDNSSSRNFQSINSNDFQYSVDEATQTESTENLILISSNELSKLFKTIENLKEQINDLKTQVIPSHITELQKQFEEQYQLCGVIKQSVLMEENKATNSDVSTCTDTIVTASVSTMFSLDTNDSRLNQGTAIKTDRLKQVAFKEFQENDQVVFHSTYIEDSSSKYSQYHQWRMLTNDGRIYFLSESSFPTNNNNNTLNKCTRQHSRSVQDGDVSRGGGGVVDSSVSYAMATSSDTIEKTPNKSATLTMSVTKKSNMVTSIREDRISNNISPPRYRCPPGCKLTHTVYGVFQFKEEYLCKKKTNRYGLPENTRFYRVNALVNWDGAEPPLATEITNKQLLKSTIHKDKQIQDFR